MMIWGKIKLSEILPFSVRNLIGKLLFSSWPLLRNVLYKAKITTAHISGDTDDY